MMTIYRPAGSVEKALLDTLSSLSPSDVGEATGKSASFFYKVSSPAYGLTFSFKDAAALDAALVKCGFDMRFIHLLADLHREALKRLSVAVPAEPHTPDIAVEMLHVNAVVGKVSATVADALADGILTLEERRGIATVAQDAIDEIRHVRDMVEPPRPQAHDTADHRVSPIRMAAGARS